jgi:transcription antitermination factor NusG
MLQEIIAPVIAIPVPSPLDTTPWFVMLTEPQQDLNTVWRLHELGLELFVPVLRRRVKTGRIGRHGHKLTRVIAKPMFPGYGFLRAVGIDDHTKVEDVRGVRDFMRRPDGDPVVLPHQAVMAVLQKQLQEHQDWLRTSGARRGPKWKRGDMVRVDVDGGAYAGLVAIVDKIDIKGRLEVLFGMIRHTLPADMVVAA